MSGSDTRPRGIRPTLLLLLTAGLVLGCEDGPTGPTASGIAAVEVAPSTSTLEALGDTITLDAVARDTSGAVVSGVTFVWTSLNPAVATVDSAGRVAATGAGETVVRATAEGVPGFAGVLVRPAPVAVAFRVEPSDAAAGSAIFPAVEVDIRDANGHRVRGATDTVALAFGANPGGATLSGEPTSTAVDGIARFPDLAIDRPASGYTLVAASGGLADATSAAFDVGPGAAARLVFVGQPADATAGDTIAPPVRVGVRDSAGNTLTDVDGLVTVGIATDPGGGTLSGTLTVPLDSGVAAFADLWIDKAAAGYTLTAYLATLESPVSAPFTIAADSPVSLEFVDSTAAAVVAGDTISPAVRVAVRDRFGNTVASATDTVTLAFDANPGGGTLAGTLSVAPDSGVATFADLWIDKAAAGYAFAASATDLAGTTGPAFAVVPAAPDHLRLLTQPTTADVQEPIPPALDVAIEDRFGNRNIDAAGAVTVELGTNPRGATLSGTLTVPPDSGVAGFADLSIELPDSGYTLRAAWDTLPPVETDPFDVLLRFALGAGQLSADSTHTCGLSETGRAYCWGGNAYGQLGDSTTTTRMRPVPVAGGHRFTMISAGGRHTCAVADDDDAWCWGSNDAGQIGDGSGTERHVPAPVAGGLAFQEVSAGWRHTCGRTTDDAVHCWGLNDEGQIGDGNRGADRATPVSVDADYFAVAAGGQHTCGIKNDLTAHCWGDNFYGQLGDGSAADKSVPTAAATGAGFDAISAGTDHTCAITYSLSRGRCWGHNTYGQLGDSTAVWRTSPEPVAGNHAYAAIGAGGWHTCGAKVEGTLIVTRSIYCWGRNDHGEVGNGPTGTWYYPTETTNSNTFHHPTAGGHHVCAHGGTTDGDVWCWGLNEFGQLGDDSMTQRTTPVRVVK